MSYLIEITSNLYNKLIKYYQGHPEEFFTLRSTSFVEYFIKDIKYRIVNCKDNFISTCYEKLSNGLFDVDFIGDSIEKTAYINISHSSSKFDSSVKWKNFLEKENNHLLEELRLIIYTEVVMNDFIKKVRLYYLNDFMNNFDSKEEILAFKAEINNIYLRINHIVSIKSHTNEENLIDEISKNKVDLLDLISNLIDGDFFSDLVLKQQKFYIKELNRLKETIVQEGNKFKCSNQVFEYYCEFIDEFIKCAQEKIELLEKTECLKKSI